MPTALSKEAALKLDFIVVGGGEFFVSVAARPRAAPLFSALVRPNGHNIPTNFSLI